MNASWWDRTAVAAVGSLSRVEGCRGSSPGGNLSRVLGWLGLLLGVLVGPRERSEGDDNPEQHLAGVDASGDDQGNRSDQKRQAPDGRDLPVDGSKLGSVPELSRCRSPCIGLGERVSHEDG